MRRIEAACLCLTLALTGCWNNRPVSPRPAVGPATGGNGANAEPTPAMPPKHVTEEDEGDGERPDSPGEAMEFRYRERLSENGKIPPNALMLAKQDRDAMIAAGGFNARNGGITSASWTPLGPGNIGGRIRSIVLHPSFATNNTVSATSTGSRAGRASLRSASVISTTASS